MKYKTWPHLKPGDLVDIVAPGMKPDAQVLKKVPEFLAQWGLKARIPKNLLGNDLICANSREMRLAHLKQALQARDSKMVWCLRGGYGSFQLLPGLRTLSAKSPKLFMGLSDTTSLHTFLGQNWNWSTVHACNIDRLVLGKTTSQEESRIRKLLFGQTTELKYKLKPLNTSAESLRSLKGVVVGGNLITLQANFATPFQIQVKGKFLFVEDIGERAYRVDRVFEQMDQLSLLKGVKALLFGQFTGDKEPNGQPSLLPRWMKEFAERQSFPVFKGIKSGHGNDQHPLPLHTPSQIIGGKGACLIVSSGSHR